MANQLEALQEAGARLGWTIVGVFSDEGISSAKGREGRPQFDKLLKARVGISRLPLNGTRRPLLGQPHGAVTRGEFDLIAAWSVDRLGRSLTDLLSFLGKLHAKGCDLYLGGPCSKMMGYHGAAAPGHLRGLVRFRCASAAPADKVDSLVRFPPLHYSKRTGMMRTTLTELE